MRKGLLILLTAIVSLTVVGCWNRRELDTLAIVTAVGIDKSKEDGKITTTMQIMKPSEIKSASSGSGGSKGVWVVTSTGYTVFDSVRNATMQSDRKLFFAQNRAIVIGEEIAREGVTPLLDLFDRDPEPRRLTWLLVAKGKAGDVIHAEHEQENIPSKAIESLIKSSDVTSMAVTVNLNDFLKNLSTHSTNAVAGRIDIINEEDGENKKIKMRVTGASVFKGDKLVGFFDRSETRGLNWINGKVKSGIIVVKSPIQETKNVALEIIRASSKITPEIQDGQIGITVEIKEEGNLGEQMSSLELTNTEMFRVLEQRKAQVIKNEIESVFKKAQKEWGTDIFGFGEAVHRKYPKEWKELKEQWGDVFPEIDVQIKVDAKLRAPGLSAGPTKAK
ncbi:MAG: Ger(x)C family spore germination protein [Tepidanaerobacteraceae bacterium]|nr:Ger(x)C family spore germination protein [Tepidanaerobacteraceae bacterium]